MSFKYFVIGFHPDGEVFEEDIPLPPGSELLSQLEQAGFERARKEVDAKLIIFLANRQDFYKLKYLRQLIDRFRPVSELNAENETIKHTSNQRFEYKPILTLYSHRVFKNNEARKRAFGIQYWDSSIWQRWVDIGDISGEHRTGKEKYQHDLRKTLSYFRWNLLKNTYSDTTALEFCEFITRVYLNAYLLQVNEGGHAGYITPFPFFEETKMITQFGSDRIKLLQDFRWRVLLINDKPSSLPHHIALFSSEEFTGLPFTVSSGTMEQNSVLTIEYAPGINQAISKLNEKNFDVIILDYLLGEIPGKGRELGIELFKRIGEVRKRGTRGRCWILLGSSFASAFIDHLREEGYPFYNEDWVIQRGADPLDTPNAFVYNFLTFLESQLKRLGEKRESNLQQIWNQGLSRLPMAPATFDKSWALHLQNQVFSYWSKMQALDAIADPDHGSLFAASYLKRYEVNKEFENGLFSYLVHFLNLLIFSDGFEWEELLIDLQKIIELANTSNGPACDVLYEYINSLRQCHD